MSIIVILYRECPLSDMRDRRTQPIRRAAILSRLGEVS
jgi:hypothetical protein